MSLPPHAATIQVFDVNGAFLRKFGSEGSGPGQLHEAAGLAFDRESNLYICDDKNRRVQVFTAQGAFITEFTDTNAHPYCVHVDREGRVLVGGVFGADSRGRVCVFAFVA